MLIRGEPGHDIVPELSPIEGEPVIDKPGRGAFAHTDFELLLRIKGIKNLVIDKDVQGKGTFLFRELPCDRAFGVVFETMGLRAKTYGNVVVNVSPRSK